MRLLGLDFETTGLDTAKERITEIGLALWDSDAKRPLVTFGLFCYDASYEPYFTEEVCSLMDRLSGITPTLLREFGTDPKGNLAWMDSFCAKHKVDYVVAHNGENFDRPLLYAELARNGVPGDCLRSLPWIDTRTDIPFASEPDSRRLQHLALDAGFINPFSHRAVFDVLTMLRVLSNYDLKAVLEYQSIPFITIRALVDYDNRHLAKSQRFAWEKIGEKTYPKMWVKKIKANRLDAEKQACNFQIARIE